MCKGQELVMRRIRDIELLPAEERIKATDALINQVEGQPKQVVHELRPDLSNMNAEELRQLYKNYSDEIEDMEAGQT